MDYRPEQIKPRDARKNMEEIMESGKIAILEKPDGKTIIFHVINSEEMNEKRCEVESKPRRGLTKDQIDLASRMLHKHPCFRSFFDSVPLREYYLHVIFYGEGFSEDIKYMSTNLAVAFIEVPDIENDTFRIGSFDIYQKFLGDTGLNIEGVYSGKLPVLYLGPPNHNKISDLKNISELAENGEGESTFVICSPIYNQTDGKLMIFESQGD